MGVPGGMYDDIGLDLFLYGSELITEDFRPRSFEINIVKCETVWSWHVGHLFYGVQRASEERGHPHSLTHSKFDAVAATATNIVRTQLESLAWTRIQKQRTADDLGLHY